MENETASKPPFDPSRYLSKLQGADYLEVKWRLLWLRTEHPEATVESQMMCHSGQAAVFRVEIAIPGSGSATGWGSESYGDFRDYIEKAETKAVGRALAALGFGTQFAGDFADLPAIQAGAAAVKGSQMETEKNHKSNVNTAPAPHQSRPDSGTPAQPRGDESPVVKAWSRNIRNARTPAALAKVIGFLAENGLRDQPALAALVTEQEEAVRSES